MLLAGVLTLVTVLAGRPGRRDPPAFGADGAPRPADEVAPSAEQQTPVMSSEPRGIVAEGAEGPAATSKPDDAASAPASRPRENLVIPSVTRRPAPQASVPSERPSTTATPARADPSRRASTPQPTPSPPARTPEPAEPGIRLGHSPPRAAVPGRSVTLSARLVSGTCPLAVVWRARGQSGWASIMMMEVDGHVAATIQVPFSNEFADGLEYYLACRQASGSTPVWKSRGAPQAVPTPSALVE